MRMCNGCGRDKPLAEFAKSTTGKDGHRATCKQCINNRQAIRGWRGPSVRLPLSVTRKIGL